MPLKFLIKELTKFLHQSSFTRVLIRLANILASTLERRHLFVSLFSNSHLRTQVKKFCQLFEIYTPLFTPFLLGCNQPINK
jgi:hypothetical protein